MVFLPLEEDHKSLSVFEEQAGKKEENTGSRFTACGKKGENTAGGNPDRRLPVHFFTGQNSPFSRRH
jgi:hypothetical protein